jgi:hypothetical protein
MWLGNMYKKRYYKINMNQALMDGDCHAALADSFSAAKFGRLSWDGQNLWVNTMGGNTIYCLTTETRPAGVGQLHSAVVHNRRLFQVAGDATSTTIRYQVRDCAAEVAVSVQNIAGSQVRLLASGIREKGDYDLRWDWSAEHISAGIYILQVRVGTAAAAQALLVIK